MKTLFTILALSFGISVSAQTTSEHLTFKGVPIDGTLMQFVSNMKTAGFKSEGVQDGVAVLSGDFAGYKGCYIYVSTLKNKDLVCSIGVLFPVRTTWSPLESNYYNLKEMLTTKYGEPEKEVEEFQERNPSDDNSKLHELQMNRCTYYTMFSTENGKILLELMHGDLLNCYVMLTYHEKSTVRKLYQLLLMTFKHIQ